MVKIQAQITPSWQRAAERAYQDRQAGRTAERIGCKTYRVASASGNGFHIVTIQSVVNLQATCDCTAGQRGLPCRHAAAALCEATRIIAAAERERASAPAPAAALTPERRAEVQSLMARFARQ